MLQTANAENDGRVNKSMWHMSHLTAVAVALALVLVLAQPAHSEFVDKKCTIPLRNARHTRAID